MTAREATDRTREEIRATIHGAGPNTVISHNNANSI